MEISVHKIRVPDTFLCSEPARAKISSKRSQFRANVDSPDFYVTLDPDNVLLDGYITLLLHLELGIQVIKFQRSEHNWKGGATTQVLKSAYLQNVLCGGSLYYHPPMPTKRVLFVEGWRGTITGKSRIDFELHPYCTTYTLSPDRDYEEQVMEIYNLASTGDYDTIIAHDYGATAYLHAIQGRIKPIRCILIDPYYSVGTDSLFTERLPAKMHEQVKEGYKRGQIIVSTPRISRAVMQLSMDIKVPIQPAVGRLEEMLLWLLKNK